MVFDLKIIFLCLLHKEQKFIIQFRIFLKRNILCDLNECKSIMYLIHDVEIFLILYGIVTQKSPC